MIQKCVCARNVRTAIVPGAERNRRTVERIFRGRYSEECLESHLLKRKNSGMVGRFAPIATMSPFQVLRRHTDDSQN